MKSWPAEKNVNALYGVRLQVYSYLLKCQKEVGPSEVQRAIGLKTASHASYHLSKLVEAGIVQKTPRNTYLLSPEYNIKSLKLNVMIDYYLINGKFWPKSAFIATFLLLSLLSSMILLLLGETLMLGFFLLMALVVAIYFVATDVRRQFMVHRQTNGNSP